MRWGLLAVLGAAVGCGGIEGWDALTAPPWPGELATSSSTSSTGGGPQVCTPGTTIACQCGTLGGHETCEPDGTAWSSCDCGSGSSSSSSTSSSASSTSSSSSSSTSTSSSSSGSFCGGCPVPSNPCDQATCVNSMCGEGPAPKGKACSNLMGGTVCDGTGDCVPWVPVVCRTSPTKTYTGCDGTTFSGYHIDWKINGMDWGCDGKPAEHGVCSPGTPCTVTVVPAITLQGICE